MRVSRIINAEIADNREIAKGIFKMRLKLPAGYPCPAPGQFVCLYLNDESRLLPRPFSVCDWEGAGLLTLVYGLKGAGTKIMSGYGSGTVLRVSTPAGNGFNTQGIKECLLVGGGIGAPPLVYLSKSHANDVSMRAVLGFKSEPFLEKDFHCSVEVATEDGSAGFKGNVLDLIKKSNISCEYIFACGPKPMLKALAGFAAERGLSLWVSLEERMGCGFGACLGCVCRTRAGSRKICQDGPVFEAGEVIWDE